MNVIGQIVTAILKWLEELAGKDTHGQFAQPQDDLKRDLRERIDRHERMRQPGDPRS